MKLKKSRFYSKTFVETLEPRVLLSADLSGTINTSLLPSVLVPGASYSIPIAITNHGNAAASGSIAINLYASADQTLETNSDSLLKSFVGQSINIAAGSSQTVNAQFTLPNTSPGSVFLLADIDANQVIVGDNRVDNVAKSDAPVTIAYQFGTVGGKANSRLTVVDDAGAAVTFTLKGAGTGELIPGNNTADLSLTGTNAASSVAISVKGGNGFATLHNITVLGSLKSLSAPNIDVSGSVNFNASGANSGTVASLRFHDLLNSENVTINGSGVPLTFIANHVAGTFLGTLEPIKAVTVNQWTADGTIIAASIGKLTSSGEFNADISLSGAGIATGRSTLGSVKTGAVTGGVWVINGNSGPISTLDINEDWTASITGNLSALTVKGNVGGLLGAAQIGKISVSGNLLHANLVGGANFGSDGQPGGVEGAADTFAVGSILSLSVGGTVTDSFIAAGYNPGDGLLFNGNDSLINGGTIKAITVKGAVATSHFLAQTLPKTVSINGTAIVPHPGVDVLFTIPVSASGPNTPPVINATLTTDTGASATDKITNLVNIGGTVIDLDGITEFVAGFGNTPSFDILSSLSNGAFALTPLLVEQINGGSMPDGDYTLHLRVTDSFGSVSNVTVPFTFDTTPPVVPTLALSDGTNSGTPDDTHTTLSLVNLTGTTSPNMTVSLINHDGTVTSDNDGVFTFTGVSLALGANSFIVSVADTAGNHSVSVPAVIITRDAPAVGLSAFVSGSFETLDATHYRYTLKMFNDGSTNVGTFWFAWVPGGDFLSVAPTNIVSPTGWAATGGLSIKWQTSSAPLASGAGPLIFQFDSTEAPEQLGADAPGHPGTPAITSFVYIGAPFGDPGFQLVVVAD